MRHPALALACPFVLGLAYGGFDPRCLGLAELIAVAGAGTLGLALLAGSGGHTLRTGALAAAMVGVGGALGAHDGLERADPGLRRAFVQHTGERSDGGPVHVTGVLRTDAQAPREGGAFLLLTPTVVDGEPVRRVGGPMAIRLSVAGTPAADAVRRWREGTTVRVPGYLRVPVSYRNPGGEDAALSLARRGVALVGSVKSAALVEIVAPASGLDAWAADVRAGIRARAGRHLSASPRALAVCLAILIGDRTGLDDETVDRLRRAGTFHVIAISGGNVAMFTTACVVALRLLRLRPRWAAACAIGVVALFGAVVERGASVDRALAVAVIYLLAHVLDHRASPLNVVGLTALGSGVLDPAIVFDVGALLTFGASAGLLVGASATSAWLGARVTRPRGRRAARAATLVIDAVAATLAAEVAVVPISAVAFGQVTVAGVVLNLVAIPAMAVVQFAGMAMLALSTPSPGLASLATRATTVASDVLIESARLVDVAPWLVIDTHRAAAVVRASAPAAVAPRDVARADAPLLRITFLDVGQGDATLVQFPSGASLLVDAGGAAGTSFDIGGRVIAPALRALGVTRLTWLVLTHGDPDHISGASRLVSQFRPAEVWEGVPVPRHEALADVLETARRLGIPVRNVVAGDRVHVDGVEVRVLHPALPEWERQRVRNDDSVVVELRYGDVQIILPGDVGDVTEAQLVARLRPLGRVVVKAAHHGSRTSSGEAWVAALRPDAVVFSAGRANRFGHPAPDVTARYDRVGAQAFRTDRDGAVLMATDGSQVWAVTMEGRRWWTGRRR